MEDNKFMEQDELSKLLIKLRDSDETRKFENLQKVLQFCHDSANPKYRELLYEEAIRLADRIDEMLKAEMEDDL